MAYKDKQKQKESQQKAYLKDKENYLNRNRQRRDGRKVWWSNFLSTQKCFFCEECSPECIDLHHIDPSEKDENVSKLIREFRSMERVKNEIQKCVSLCANCHRKFHKGTIEFAFTEEHTIKFEEWSEIKDSNL